MSTIVRPYGDTLDDGAVQLSFTLPVPFGPRGREAARLLVEKLGFRDEGLRERYLHIQGEWRDHRTTIILQYLDGQLHEILSFSLFPGCIQFFCQFLLRKVYEICGVIA